MLPAATQKTSRGHRHGAAPHGSEASAGAHSPQGPGNRCATTVVMGSGSRTTACSDAGGATPWETKASVNLVTKTAGSALMDCSAARAEAAPEEGPCAPGVSKTTSKSIVQPPCRRRPAAAPKPSTTTWSSATPRESATPTCTAVAIAGVTSLMPIKVTDDDITSVVSAGAPGIAVKAVAVKDEVLTVIVVEVCVLDVAVVELLVLVEDVAVCVEVRVTVEVQLSSPTGLSQASRPGGGSTREPPPQTQHASVAVWPSFR